ncbi:hypothetical protein [Lacticaseibacillus suihuaensis]
MNNVVTIHLDPETQAQVDRYLALHGVSLNVFAAWAMRQAIEAAESSDPGNRDHCKRRGDRESQGDGATGPTTAHPNATAADHAALEAAQREAAAARAALDSAATALAQVRAQYGV